MAGIFSPCFEQYSKARFRNQTKNQAATVAWSFGSLVNSRTGNTAVNR
jgi:hypothetical protein